MSRLTKTAFQAAAVFLCAVLFERQSAAQPVTVRLKVAHHQDMPLTNGIADAILLEMTKAIQTKDGVDDVACNMELLRDGDVAKFAVGDGSLDSQDEWFELLKHVDAHVIVVSQINWCGKPGPAAIGCAPTPGTKLIVERRFAAPREGVLWLHEYGHNRGLQHRDEPLAVMRDFIHQEHRHINQAEHNAYLKVAAGGNQNPPAPAQEPKVPVADFVKRVYVQGVPWDKASQYNADDVMPLLGLLNDRRQAEHHSNVIETLALIGDGQAVQPIMGYIGGEGQISPFEYQAKLTAVMHLGTLHNKTRNGSPLQYLQDSVRQRDFWNERVRWTTPSRNPEKRNQDLANMAAWGLALSGSEEGINTLTALKAGNPPSPANASTVAQALEAGRQVQQNGLMKYWQMAMQPRAQPQ